LGIGTQIFKAHSLRGAAATAMMEQGVFDDGVAQHSMSITEGSTKECNGSGYSCGATAKEACHTVLCLLRRPLDPEMRKEIGGVPLPCHAPHCSQDHGSYL
jgi:hypothetical protein